MKKVKTRNNIYYDLKLSPFIYTTEQGVKFHFSSQLYHDKFKDQYLSYRERVENYLTKTYSIDVETKVFADVVLYSKIEKRGFLIISARGEEFCKEKILSNGAMLILKN